MRHNRHWVLGVAGRVYDDVQERLVLVPHARSTTDEEHEQDEQDRGEDRLGWE